jgi:predicted dehydrogenase
MVRAAIIGLGRWGCSLVRSVHGRSEACGIRFVAAHTRTPASVQEFCGAHDLPLLESYEQILADSTIDAVVLATPHSQHAGQIMAAAAAHKHVFVEKPITLSRASADDVVAATRNAGVVLAVGFCRRFHPCVVELRNHLRDGRLGAVVSMVAQHATSTGQFVPPDNWRAAPKEAPGGAFTAVGVHSLDHMIEFAGRVRNVACVTSRYLAGASDDTTTLMLQFANGATGLIFCSVATATNFSFTLYGTRGLAEISRPNLQRFRFVPCSTEPPSGPITAPPDQVSEHTGFNMLAAELAAFARSISTAEPFLVPIPDVLHGMSVFDAAVRSARSNRIEQVEPGVGEEYLASTHFHGSLIRDSSFE